MDHDAISFTARFGGVPHMVYVPMQSIIAIYPREDISLGVSMYPERAYDEEQSPEVTSAKEEETPKKSGVTLEVIDSAHADATPAKPQTKPNGNHKPSLELVE